MRRTTRSPGLRLPLAIALMALVCTTFVVAEAPSGATEPGSTAVSTRENRQETAKAMKAEMKAKKCTDPLGCIDYKK